MRRAVWAAAVSIMAISCAQAADVEPLRGPSLPPPVFSWTGFYVGANGGFGSARASVPGFSETLNGAVAGVQFGVNYQMGNFVIGVEADFQGTTQKATFSSSFGSFTDQFDWFETERIRLGYALDNWLFYATAGVGDGQTTATGTSGFSTLTIVDRRFAYVAGGGVEVGGWNGLSLRAEYLYLNSPANTAVFSNVDAQDHIFRLGINWRFFGGPAPRPY